MKADLNSFVIADPSKCIGCRSCEVACAASHRDKDAGFTVGTMDTPIVPRLYLVKEEKVVMPIQCRHCEDAPCANACPVNAIEQDDGSIRVNESACIGCKTCMLVCPVGAVDLLPRYDKKQSGAAFEGKAKLVAHKCDLCKENGGTPACVKACPKEALKLAVPRDEKKDRNIKAALGLLDFNSDI